MKHYVDVCIDAYPQSIIRLALTGGECFLLGDDLDEIVRYGTDKGLKVDFMSNGFWGKSYRIAEDTGFLHYSSNIAPYSGPFISRRY